MISNADVFDLDIVDSNTPENELTKNEDLSCLRRELAFISSEYRDVVVPYYIDDISLKHIASSLNITENAAKMRLFRARNILKEGMNMAREFGLRSYKPENMSFMMNGLMGKNNEPWNFLRKSLCKNIMLATYHTPSTAEEIAIEVGVALPYIEEELSELVSATLMRKNGNKYETNFFIVSADAQEKIYRHLREIAPALTEAIIEASNFDIDYANQINPEWLGGNQSAEDRKWAFLMAETDTINSYTLENVNTLNYDKSSLNLGSWGHTIRPNGGEWDILGMEHHHGDEPMFVSLHGCVNAPEERDLPDINFRHYTFQSFGQELFNQSLSYIDGQTLVAIAKGENDKADPIVLDRLVKNGYLSKANGTYTPKFCVIYKANCHKKPTDVQESFEKLRYKARDIAVKHYNYCRNLIMQEIPKSLKEDHYQVDHACANIFTLRGAVVEEAIRMGYLTIPEDIVRKKMLGAFLTV